MNTTTKENRGGENNLAQHGIRRKSQKQNWIVYLVLCVVALLLAGGFPAKGKNVFCCVYNKDVVLDFHGYRVANNQRFQYTGDEDSYICLQNYTNTDTVAIKFLEEAETDVPVYTKQLANDGSVLEEADTVWRKGSSLLEISVTSSETESIEVSIRDSFTVERSMYASNYQQYRKKMKVCILAILLAALMSFLLTGTRWGKGILQYLCRKKHTFISMFDKKRIRKYRLEWITIVLILIIGGLFSFLEPPIAGICNEDAFHYIRSEKFAHPVSKTVPMSGYEIEYQSVSGKSLDDMFQWEQRARYSRYLNELDRKGYTMINYDKTWPGLAFLPYIPYTVLHMVLRTLHVPWTIRFMLGRWINVWFFAVFAALSMKRLQSGKLVVSLLALAPGVIFLASNYTYDTWITILYLFGMCCVFGELQDVRKPIGTHTPVKLFGALVLAGIPKPVYFPINAIAFFMPRSKFRTKAGYWEYKIAAVCNVFFPVFLMWLRTFAGGVATGDTRGGSDVNAAMQIQWALEYPRQFAGVILQYLKSYLNPFGFGKAWANYFAYLGKLDIGGLIFILIMLGVIVSLAKREPGRFPWWYRMGLLFVYFAVGAIVAVAMYVVFTPVGAEYVQGAQPRYLIPVLFPTYYGITRISGGEFITDKRIQKAGHIGLLSAMVIINIYAILTLCLARY